MNFIKAIVAAGLVAASTSAFAADITGAGATFPYPVYSKWADAYKKDTGNGLNYQSIGSGAGIKQIQAKTVTFGASDAPLKPEQLEKDGLVQWPMVMGAIVPVVNLEGVKPDELVLSGEALADIYLGKITKWNDPAIAKANPSAKLPATDIVVVHRSDGSGTSFVWTDFLTKVSADWKAQIGEGTAVKWSTGVGGKGNEGVANYVARIDGAIGDRGGAERRVRRVAGDRHRGVALYARLGAADRRERVQAIVLGLVVVPLHERRTRREQHGRHGEPRERERHDEHEDQRGSPASAALGRRGRRAPAGHGTVTDAEASAAADQVGPQSIAKTP